MAKSDVRRTIALLLLLIISFGAYAIEYPGQKKMADSLFKARAYQQAGVLYKSILPFAPDTDKAVVYLRVGLFYHLQQKMDSALFYYEEGVPYASNNRDSILLANLYNNIGAIHNHQGSYVSSIKYYNKALSIYSILKIDDQIALGNYNIAHHYKELAIYDKAAEYLFLALEKFKELNNSKKVALCYQTLGNIYKDQQDYLRSLDYHKKALGIRESEKDTAGSLRSYNDIGNTYKAMNHFNEALAHYEKALKTKNKTFLARTLDNMGEVHLEQDQLDKAKRSFEESLLIKKINKDRKGLVSTLTGLGDLYLRLGMLDTAEMYLLDAGSLAESMKVDDELLRNYNLQIALFKEKKDFQAALQISEKYISLMQIVYSTERTETLETLRADYELNADLNALNVTVNNTQDELARIQKVNRLLVTVVIISVLLVAAFVWIVRTWIKSTQRERNFRREVQHRTENSLQILMSIFSLQSLNIENPETRDFAKKSQMRVDALMKIYNALKFPKGSTLINFTKFLKSLVDDIKTAFGNPEAEVRVEFDMDELELDVDKVTALGLMCNELIINAFKYGFHQNEDPCLRVVAKQNSRSISIVIKDNGPGVGASMNSGEIGSSSGLGFVKAFQKQLKASFELKSDHGTEAIIELTI